MSRDAYDDGYDDGGGREDYDDDADRGRGPNRLALAKMKVSTPGMMLLMFGIFALCWALLNAACMALAPDTFVKPLYDWQVDMQKNQPGGPKMPPYEEYLKAQLVQNLIFDTIHVLTSIPIIFAGLKMRNLQSYGLAMTGTIMAMIPCVNSCCCVGLPVGIWVLITLLNADVKEGFRLTASRAAGY